MLTMKNTILITVTILLFTGISSVQAQESKLQINKVYLFGAFGPAGMDASGSSFGISTVINKKWIASVGKLKSYMNTKLPADFFYENNEPNWFLLLLLLDPYSLNFELEDETRFTYLSFGRNYALSRKFSFIVDGGLGLAKQQSYNFYKKGQPVKNNEYIVEGVSSNYTVTSIERSSIGAMARVGLDWTFAGFGGMGLDLYYNMNAGGIYDNWGINLRFNLGYMPRYGKNALKQ
jgi:hypothetical protein